MQPTRRRVHWSVIALLVVCAGLLLVCTVSVASALVTGSKPKPIWGSYDPTPTASTYAPLATAGEGVAASATPAATVRVVPPPVHVSDGVYTVGVDIPAGTYRVTAVLGADAFCYWEITKTGSNGQSIVANDIPSGGRPSVTLKQGEDFNTDGCGTWARVK